VDIKSTGFQAKRVEKVLDDHRSKPMEWLRESARYLAPTGQGDVWLAASAAVRNSAAVLVVIITSLLTLFLLATSLRAVLWELDRWRAVENFLLTWSTDHWWLSPLLLLPAFWLAIAALPLGWGFWMTQKGRGEKPNIPAYVAVCLLIVLGLCAAILGLENWWQCNCGQLDGTPGGPCLQIGCGTVAAVVGSLTLLYWRIAWWKAKRKASAQAKQEADSGREDKPTAPETEQRRLDVTRNLLSRWFAFALLVLVVLLALGLIDTCGQMAYALMRPEKSPGLKGLLAITGFAALLGLAPKVHLLLDQLPNRKAAQIPVSVIASVAALLVAAGLLVSIAAFANGIGWCWLNPAATAVITTKTPEPNAGHTNLPPLSIQIPKTNTAPQSAAASPINTLRAYVATSPPQTIQLVSTNPLSRFAATSATNAASTTNAIPPLTVTNIAVINLSKQLHGDARVILTPTSLIQVVDRPDIDPSPLANGMCWRCPAIALVIALALAFLFGRLLTFLNLSSHQAMYSARITRAYHGASNPDRWFGDGQRLGEALPSDDVLWRKYDPHASGGPLHIVNVTLNETVSGKSQIEYRDRHGLAMAAGPAGLSIGTRFHALWIKNLKDEPTDIVQPLSTNPHFHSERPNTPKPWWEKFGRYVREFVSAPNGCQLSDKKTATAFCYHPLYSGWENVKTGQPQQNVERLSLRQWIGISGAAFTTGLGKGTTLGKSFLLGLFNVRLGYWWDSYIEPADRERITPKEYVEGDPLHTFLSWAFPVQAHLMDECLARFRGPNNRLWYLSDGGHFENTGAYELIRRRAPLIIVCDCGCDTDYACEDLAELVRMVRIDFGAEIDFFDEAQLDSADLGDSRAFFGTPAQFKQYATPAKTTGTEKDASKKTELTGPHAMLAWVNYPDAKGDPYANGRSLLLILKPSLSGDEPLDVAHYQAAFPDFPQQSTLDQFFNEAQWESYRKLGRHIGEKLFPEKREPDWLNLVPKQ
jgi:hypothetical protein